MDTFEDDKTTDEEVKPGSPLAKDNGDNDEALPPDELGGEEAGEKGGDLENLDSWGLETDLEE